jgi:hypothetical protein
MRLWMSGALLHCRRVPSSCSVCGQAHSLFCSFVSHVSGESKFVGTVASRRYSVQALDDMSIEPWRMVIGGGKFKCSGEDLSPTHPTSRQLVIWAACLWLSHLWDPVKQVGSITPVTTIMEVPASTLSWGTSYPDWGIIGFPQLFQANSARGHQIGKRLLSISLCFVK